MVVGLANVGVLGALRLLAPPLRALAVVLVVANLWLPSGALASGGVPDELSCGLFEGAAAGDRCTKCCLAKVLALPAVDAPIVFRSLSRATVRERWAAGPIRTREPVRLRIRGPPVF